MQKKTHKLIPSDIALYLRTAKHQINSFSFLVFKQAINNNAEMLNVRKQFHTKVTPDLQLTCRVNGENMVLVFKP